MPGTQRMASMLIAIEIENAASLKTEADKTPGSGTAGRAFGQKTTCVKRNKAASRNCMNEILTLRQDEL